MADSGKNILVLNVGSGSLKLGLYKYTAHTQLYSEKLDAKKQGFGREQPRGSLLTHLMGDLRSNSRI